MRITRVLMILLVPAVGLFAQGCNPEAAAMAVFKKQGLVVLKPARDYVKVGGLVSVKDKTPRYRDPADAVPTDANVATNFKAVIMAESSKKEVGVGVAAKAIGSVVPIPINVGADSKGEVSISQVDTSGIRLVSDALDAQIQKKNTAAKIRELLAAGSKVYIVEEVYLAKSIELTASSKSGLEVSLGSGAAVEACAAGAEGAKKDEAKKDEAKKDEAKKDEAKKDEPKKDEPKKDEAKKGDAQKPDTKSAVADAASKTALADVSVGVKVCRSGSYSLKFHADAPLPFAVRLAEVELRNGQLRIREGSFRFPNSLGVSYVEKSTATDISVLTGLVREQ